MAQQRGRAWISGRKPKKPLKPHEHMPDGQGNAQRLKSRDSLRWLMQKHRTFGARPGPRPDIPRINVGGAVIHRVEDAGFAITKLTRPDRATRVAAQTKEDRHTVGINTAAIKLESKKTVVTV